MLTVQVVNNIIWQWSIVFENWKLLQYIWHCLKANYYSENEFHSYQQRNLKSFKLNESVPELANAKILECCRCEEPEKSTYVHQCT